MFELTNNGTMLVMVFHLANFELVALGSSVISPYYLMLVVIIGFDSFKIGCVFTIKVSDTGSYPYLVIPYNITSSHILRT